MKYVSLLLLLIGSTSLYAMDDDGDRDQSKIIMHELGETAQSAAFSADGKTMVVGFENNTLEMYRLGTDQEERPTIIRRRTFRNRVNEVRMIPNSDKVVTQFWDSCDTDVSDEYSSYAGRYWDKYNAQGDSLSLSRPHRVYVCDKAGTIMWEFKDEGIEDIRGDSSIDENGHVVISSDHRVQMWDYKNNARKVFDRSFEKRINSMRLSPDGDKLFVSLYPGDDRGHTDGAVWDTKTNEQLYELPYISNVRFVDDKLLASSDCLFNNVSIIDAFTGRALSRMPGSMMRINGCVFSPNDKYFAQLGWGIVRVYDIKGAGNLIASVDSKAEVDRIKAISPQGDCMVVTTRQNKTVLLNLIRKKSKCWCGTTCDSKR